MNIPPRVLAKGAAILAGGYVSLIVVSKFSVTGVAMLLERERKKTALPCRVCAGNCFQPCQLCNATGSLAWSPLADPVLPWPCQCPTCEGNKVQRCLNCIGRGNI